MTFQVALIGCDGLIIASDRMMVDRRWGPRAFAVHQAELNQRMRGTKTILSDHNDVVCAFAGGPAAESMARAIASDCRPEGLSLLQWQNCVEDAVKSIRGSGYHVLDEILVARTDDWHYLLRVLVQNTEAPSFLTVEEYVCTGDILGSARFLIDHFWRKDMNVSQLKKLALLAIAYASKENPSGIGGGADIVTIKAGWEMAVDSASESHMNALQKEFDCHASAFS